VKKPDQAPALRRLRGNSPARRHCSRAAMSHPPRPRPPGKLASRDGAAAASWPSSESRVHATTRGKTCAIHIQPPAVDCNSGKNHSAAVVRLNVAIARDELRTALLFLPSQLPRQPASTARRINHISSPDLPPIRHDSEHPPISHHRRYRPARLPQFDPNRYSVPQQYRIQQRTPRLKSKPGFICRSAKSRRLRLPFPSHPPPRMPDEPRTFDLLPNTELLKKWLDTRRQRLPQACAGESSVVR
jgi:hypothetical protein